MARAVLQLRQNIEFFLFVYQRHGYLALYMYDQLVSALRVGDIRNALALAFLYLEESGRLVLI